MNNERAQQLLSAYRTDTAPDHEDALFDAIVRRIVTTDDEALVDAVCGGDVEFDEFDEFDEFEDGVTEDEPSANSSPQAARRRRSVVLPVALATAALAAGLVLALSVRGELLSATGEASPWQAPNVEEAELPWWRRIVPRRLLDDAEVEVVSAVDTDEANVEDAAVLDDGPAPVAPRIGRATSPTPASSDPTTGEPAASIPAAVLPDPADGWGAPLYDPRSTGPEPRTKPAGAVGGAYPGGGGGSTKPSKKNDSGRTNDGDADGDSPSPSNPRPSSGGGGGGGGDGDGGGGGGGGDNGDPPGPPPTPEPPDFPPDEPGPDPHERCMEILDTCSAFGMGPDCDVEYQYCICEQDLEDCQRDGGDPVVCFDAYESCAMPEMLPTPEECFDQYQMCSWEAPPELCIDDLGACFRNYGGLAPEQCVEMASTCEAIEGPLQCEDVAIACESAIDPLMRCEHQFHQCMETAPPEAQDMCEGAFDECVADLYGEPGPEEVCWSQFGLCMIESAEDPMVCEAELDACVAE